MSNDVLPEAGAPFPTSRYELVCELGAGAMGVVYRVVDRENDREVALKTLRSADPDDLYRLKREFRSLATVSHRHLVQLYELEVVGAQAFFTMEWIRGGDFLAFVCEAGQPFARDPERLRDAFTQLAHGLSALHDRGILHRDVKPSNVLVDDEGRVVLVDFGLALGMGPTDALASQSEGFAGTLAYTAPEQAWGQPLTPAADWYGAGVVLYEALTGCLPFDGLGLGAVLDRQHRLPRAPTDHAPDAAPDLVALALDLLHYEPERRPNASEVLARLRGGARAPARAADAGRAHFVGREREIAALHDALAVARRGRAVFVRVEGPSGIGKTAVVERFVASAEADAGALVLRSRCHPNESVPYAAVDGLVDDLSRFLLRESPTALEAFQPRGIRAVIRVFPVLGRVGFVESESEPDPLAADPQELRRRAFAGLRELLARVADRRVVVLWVDDLQWGDLDSAPLLEELLRPPDPPALLLVATVRSEDRDASALLAALSEREDALGEVRRIEVPPLDPEQADALLDAMLRDSADFAGSYVRRLREEAAGSPFLLAELGRYLLGRHDLLGEGLAVDLSEAVGGRIRALSPDAREILELVSVAGRPIETSIALALVDRRRAALPRVYELCNDCLLRAVPPGDRLETYHARLRDAVLGSLDPVQRRDRHLLLADALAARPGSDPAFVLDHYLGAEQPAQAAPFALRAAEQADATLAFDRAAEHYDQAARLGAGAAAELLPRRARALANAGRGSDAARVFAEAADVAERDGGGATAPSVLRGLAAEQHFYAGELEEGVAKLAEPMRRVGVRVPGGPRRRLLAAAAARARFVVRGDRVRFRAAQEISAEALAGIDTLQGAAQGASMLDHTLGDVLAARSLLAALDTGEPSRVLRALGLEAGFEANVGGAFFSRRAERLLARAASIAARTGDSFDDAWVEFCRSNVAWFSGRWRECLERGDRAVETLRARCIGTSWVMTTNHAFTISALVQLGRLRELAERLPALQADARARGDRYALMSYRHGDSLYVRLAADDLDGARAELADGGDWKGGRFLSRHLFHLMGTGYADLYEGAGTRALDGIRAAWSAVSAAGLLRLDCIGNGFQHLAGRAAVAAAAQALEAGEVRRAAALAREAGRHANRIARSRLPHAAPLAAAIRAGIASVRRDRPATIAALEEAARGHARCEMRIYEAAARWRLAELGAAPRSTAVSEEAWLRSEGVRAPERIVAMSVPMARF